MTVEQVNEIAQGRVWGGRKAQEIGLVDHLGNIDQAIEAAIARAALEDYRVIHIEDEIPFEIQLMSRLFDNQSQMSSYIADKRNSPEQILLRKITEKLSIFNKLNDPHHAYVLCVDCLAQFNPEY